MLYRREEPAAPRRSRPLSERRRCRPQLEELETRDLPSALSPAQVRQAYGFDQLPYTGAGQTIAIVDAYDDPNIAADLQAFDRQFGLPDAAFTKATPEGRPAASAGWAGEIALDVEWAHAIAPGASILLVEAKSDSLTDLLNAVRYAAARPGVVAVSMSWGSSEFAGETSLDGVFTTPVGHLGGSSGAAGAPDLPGGITFVAAAGDAGAWSGAEWPASSPNVLSVGGTTLLLSGSGAYAVETAWTSHAPGQAGGGGGFSGVEGEPVYQLAFQGSGARTAPDVAYDADPNSGVLVYDSVNGGWFVDGGTSAGAPQWAALIALADQARATVGLGSLDGPTQTLPALYALARASYGAYFHDVTSGTNGYVAGPGYDLATGLGSPQASALVPALAGVTVSEPNLALAPTAAATKTRHPKKKHPKHRRHHATGTTVALAPTTGVLTAGPLAARVPSSAAAWLQARDAYFAGMAAATPSGETDPGP